MIRLGCAWTNLQIVMWFFFRLRVNDYAHSSNNNIYYQSWKKFKKGTFSIIERSKPSAIEKNEKMHYIVSFSLTSKATLWSTDLCTSAGTAMVYPNINKYKKKNIFSCHTLPVEGVDGGPGGRARRVAEPWPWRRSACQRTPMDGAIVRPGRRWRTGLLDLRTQKQKLITGVYNSDIAIGRFFGDRRR